MVTTLLDFSELEPCPQDIQHLVTYDNPEDLNTSPEEMYDPWFGPCTMPSCSGEIVESIILGTFFCNKCGEAHPNISLADVRDPYLDDNRFKPFVNDKWRYQKNAPPGGIE